MNPINPWLDPAEVRRLAERLMNPVRDPAVNISDAGFDAAFVGYASAGPAARTPAPAPPSTAPASPANVPEPNVFEPAPAKTASESITSTAHGPFLERIQRFRDWMMHHFSATGLFILDREGAVIFDENDHARLHFLARSLALASRRQGSSSGNVHVKIGAGATLEVIPVETAYGSLILGTVVPEALAPDSVAVVMKALAQVAAPPAAR